MVRRTASPSTPPPPSTRGRSRDIREQVPMVDEEVAQGEPATMDPRLDRAHRNAGRRGDLDVLEAVRRVKQERDALLGHEASERLLEQARLLAPDERTMWIAGPIPRRLEWLFWQWISPPAAMPSLRVTAGVEDDPGQPAAHTALTSVGPRMVEGVEQALLQGILGEHAVARRPDGECVEEVLVAHNEIIEGRQVAAPSGREQRRIHRAARRAQGRMFRFQHRRARRGEKGACHGDAPRGWASIWVERGGLGSCRIHLSLVTSERDATGHADTRFIQ